MFVGVCAVGMLIGLVSLWAFAPPPEDEGRSTALTSKPSEHAPRTEPSPAETPSAARKAVMVVVGTEPVDAHLFRGEQDLGPSPVVLQVVPGEPVALVARRKGYKDAEVSVDASEPRAVVRLERARAGVERSKKDGATSGKKPVMGGSDIVNPWDD